MSVQFGCLKLYFDSIRPCRSVASLTQWRDPLWTLQDAHSTEDYILEMHLNHNVQFENPARAVATFTSNRDHEMSLSTWGYYLSCRTPSSEQEETQHPNCLINHSVCFGDHTSTVYNSGDLSDVVKINFKTKWVVSPGSKTGFIFHQSFCFTSDDEIACILYSIHWLTHQDDDPQDV